MKARALTWVLLALPAWASEPVESPWAFVPEVGAHFATRLSRADAGAFGGVSVGLGARVHEWRFGALGRFNGGGALRPWAFDAGAWVSHDLLTIKLSRALTVGFPLRLEGLVRFHDGRAPGGLVTGLLGVRVLGVQLGVGAGWEYAQPRHHGTFETRLSFDVMEVVHLFKALRQGDGDRGTNQPP